MPGDSERCSDCPSRASGPGSSGDPGSATPGDTRGQYAAYHCAATVSLSGLCGRLQTLPERTVSRGALHQPQSAYGASRSAVPADG